MRTKITILFIVFSNIIGYSQTNEFAPIGAKWYTEACEVSQLRKIQSIGDTTIVGQACRKLRSITYMLTTDLNGNYGMDSLLERYWYFYSDSNKVYLFDEHNQEFYTLYNFNVQIGDTVIVRNKPFQAWNCSSSHIHNSFFTYIIESIDSFQLDNVTLKRVYPKPVGYDQWSFIGHPYLQSNAIIELIGHNASIFGDNTGFFIPEDDERIRCYQDNNINYRADYLENHEPCDWINELISNKNNIQETLLVKIHPNPVSKTLSINIKLDEMNIKIINIIGDILYDKNLKHGENLIDVSFLNDGVYFLNAYYNNKYYKTYKIIKN